MDLTEMRKEFENGYRKDRICFYKSSDFYKTEKIDPYVVYNLPLSKLEEKALDLDIEHSRRVHQGESGDDIYNILVLRVKAYDEIDYALSRINWRKAIEQNTLDYDQPNPDDYYQPFPEELCNQLYPEFCVKSK